MTALPPPDREAAAGDEYDIELYRDSAEMADRLLELRIGPFISVDDAFAWDEGEVFRDDALTSFERFRVVWPPEFAD